MNRISLFFSLFVIIFINNFLAAKIRFITFHYDKPEFIEYQYKTFKKFILDDYELIVFNDAKDPLIDQKIQEICEKYSIQCIRYSQEWHQEEPLNEKIANWLKNPKIDKNFHKFTSDEPSEIGKHPSVRHCHVIKYALENVGYNHDDLVAFIDGDAFPIRPFSPRSLLKECDIVGTIKKPPRFPSINYLWIVFTIIDMPNLSYKEDLNFDIAVINNKIHDTGSNMYHFLLNHPDIRFKLLNWVSRRNFSNPSYQSLLNDGFTQPEINLILEDDSQFPFEFHLDKALLHFSGSSFNRMGHLSKEEILKAFITEILDE